MIIRCTLLVHVFVSEDDEDEAVAFDQRLVKVEVSNQRTFEALLKVFADGWRSWYLERDAINLRDEGFSDVEVRQITELHARVCKYLAHEVRVMQILPYDLSKLGA